MRNGTSTNSRRPASRAAHRDGSRAAGIPGRYPDGPGPPARWPSERDRRGWQAVGHGRAQLQRRAAPAPVERVRPGLWSIPVPIPNNPLRYVLVYAFETDRGPYLIDAGWNTDDAYQTLVAGWSRPASPSATSRACWSPTSTPTTTAWPGGSGRRPGPGSRLHPADARLIDARYDEPERPAGADGRHAAPGRRARRRRSPSLQQASMPIRAFVLVGRARTS